MNLSFWFYVLSMVLVAIAFYFAGFVTAYHLVKDKLSESVKSTSMIELRSKFYYVSEVSRSNFVINQNTNSKSSKNE